MRNQLDKVTVICIAHRLHTIAYYDLVVVLDQGEVLEIGRPVDLMDDSNSRFHDMCQCTGDFDVLHQIASSNAYIK